MRLCLKSKYILLLAFVLSGCDLASPQKTFRLAVSGKDYYYGYVSDHVRPFLERSGFKVTLVRASNAIEAARMVANASADLALLNNHSTSVAGTLGADAGELRTILPITSRLLLSFSKSPMPDSATARELFSGKRIGIDHLGGEAQLNLERFFKAAKIQGAKFVSMNDDPEVICFWGTYYGARAAKLLDEGWHSFSFKANWIEFITLNEPALRPITLPAVPGDKKSIRLSTVSTDVLLITHKNMGENAVYLLAQSILESRASLIHVDVMYQSISEKFNTENLLFPLHRGAAAYLRRDQPTFFERYAESLALGLSILAILYGVLQAIQNKLQRRKKERIDKYFLEFLEIRSNKSVTTELRVSRLDELFQRAVVQMTNEKLDKGDFHILSRLIQQDLTMIRFSEKDERN
jgi:TRAP-type uncharacterized transport system substrate-binding protein